MVYSKPENNSKLRHMSNFIISSYHVYAQRPKHFSAMTHSLVEMVRNSMYICTYIANP
jgi:hypothetical protein